jgi:hypothetical protein
MTYLRRHKRGWAWLAIVALVGHAVALAATTPVPRGDDVLGPLVICTADGAKTAQGDGSPDGLPPPDHCPACMPSAQFALAAAINPGALAFPTPPAPRPVPTGADPLAVHLVLGGIHSRGPPHAA